MDEIKEFFSNVFETEYWPARWHCGYWSDFHGWLYILSDLSIWAAYFTIPVIIIKFVSKKSGIRFYGAYFWFAAFILACGFTHLLDAIIFWYPVYRFAALVRFITALISWFTIYYLIKMLPMALALKTPFQLEHEVALKEGLLKEVEKSNMQLKKQNEFTEKILNSSTDNILVFDTELNLISANKKAESILKKTEKDVIGKNFNTLFKGAINAEYYQDLKEAVKGNAIKNKISLSAANKYYETSFTPLFENELQYAVLVISRDITDTLEREDSLKVLNQKLNSQNDKLKHANAELEHFNYILSHDLQEPLRKIQVYSNIIIEKNEKEENSKYLEKIDGSAKRMKNLIQDVLSYSRANHPSEAFKRINLNQVLEEVKTDFELPIAQHEAVIHSHDLPEIEGIKYQINQVFYNLIGNSLKYSNKKPQIDISYKILNGTEADTDKKYIELVFKDNGIGFDPAYSEIIFHPFKRLQNEKEYEGTGIGLALVKKIVEYHKGTIIADSKLGEGSVFKVTLPVSQI